ncbi:putative RING-H2 finger protein ATL21A [Forsythia ovata]|uniref:RING-type E3 ubiquitin transferase n=1 Tax=Forsythia ovata TaxID=205694 RepID=A0ABD1Q257_9LAMI
MILNLPFSGDFYVRYIDYYSNKITLYDPRNCLPGRLLNNSMNLSSSPFTAPYYENYTFYTCPKNAEPVGYYALPIGCLSNSTNATIATTREAPEEFEYFGCKIIGSSIIPVMYQGQFDYQGIDDDLSLYWNASDCKDCDPQPSQETGSDHSCLVHQRYGEVDRIRQAKF